MLLAFVLPVLAGDWTGTWVAEADGAAMQAVMDAAVQTALEGSFNRLTRPIARPRLAKAARFCSRYELAITETLFTIQCDDRDQWTRPIDGTVTKLDAKESGVVDTRIARHGDVILLEFEGETGTRANTYTFAEDGRLELQVAVKSGYLKQPMTWTLTYKPQ